MAASGQIVPELPRRQRMADQVNAVLKLSFESQMMTPVGSMLLAILVSILLGAISYVWYLAPDKTVLLK